MPFPGSRIGPDLASVRPNVKYFCDVDYDPFVFMEEHNKTYSRCLAKAGGLP